MGASSRVTLVALSLTVAATSAWSFAASEELPFELAFDRRQLPQESVIRASPSGEWVAFTVRHASGDLNLDARYQANGTPTSSVGDRVVVAAADGGEARDVCPANGNCWRPSWSPDSAGIAFYSDADGFPQLFVHHLSSGMTTKVSEARIKPKLWVGDEPMWSPDGSRLFVPLAPDQDRNDWSSFMGGGFSQESPPDDIAVTVLTSGSESSGLEGQEAEKPLRDFIMFENNATLAGFDVDTRSMTVLADADGDPSPSVLRISPSGRWLTYLSVFKNRSITSQRSTVDLALVSTAGGEVQKLASDLPLMPMDYHRLTYRWHPTRDLIVYVDAEERLQMIEIGERGAGRARSLGDGLAGFSSSPLLFTRDGEHVMVGVEPLDRHDGDQSGRSQGIGVVPLDGASGRRIDLAPPWHYLSLISTDEGVLWQPNNSVTVLARHSLTGESSVLRYDLDALGTSSPVTLWSGIARFRSFSGSATHEDLFAIYEDLGTPPDIYRFDTTLAEKRRVSRVEPRLADTAKPRAEVIEVTVPLHDGRLSRARTAILLPPGVSKGDRPPGIVLMYPGGNVTADVERFGGGQRLSIPTLLFLSRGYAVIMADLQLGPSGESGNPMQEMVDVLLPQVYRAAELGYVDLERLAIGGQSFGGFGAAAIVSRTNLFRAAVAVSGIFDLGGTYGHLGESQTSFWVGWAEGGQARMGDHPWANLRRYIDNSPYYQADKIKTPLLLVHGTEDWAVHDAEKLFVALRRLDRDVQLALYEGEGHVIFNWRHESAADASRRIVDFLERNLASKAEVN